MDYLDYLKNFRLDLFYYDVIEKGKGKKRMSLEKYKKFEDIFNENKGTCNVTYVPVNEVMFNIFFNDNFRITFLITNFKHFKHYDTTLEEFVPILNHAFIEYGTNYEGLLAQIKKDYVDENLEKDSEKLNIE